MKIIIVGAGQVGFHIASHLALENKNVVLIDNHPGAVRRVSESIDVQVLQGSGSSPRVLEEAGIRDAEIFLAVTDSDETNLVACLMADNISGATLKLARVRAADFDDYHEHFKSQAPHIDRLINPEVEVVKAIEQFIDVPGAVDLIEFADGRVKIVGVHLTVDSALAGVRLMELPNRVTGRRPPLIAAITRKENLIIPRGEERLQADDTIYFACEDQNLAANMALFGKQAEPVKRILVVGGGRIGWRLAAMLENKSVQTKIIEKDEKRCQMLAGKLNKAVVFNGDGSDQNLLQEENIAAMDVVVSLTGDEETNILVSLLAKQLGATQTITKISKFSYLPVMATIGLDRVVNARLSAINSILQYIRRGKVLSAKSIKGEQAEIIEAEALATSDMVGKPLRDIAFPKGALITTIIRGEKVIIPSGEDYIAPGDHIIIFAQRQAIAKIEKILTVKLEYF